MNSLKNEMDLLDDILWSRKIDFKKLYEIVSDLKTNKEEQKFLLNCIIEEDYNTSKHIIQCMKEFGDVFIEVLYEANSNLRTFSNMTENPLAEIQLDKMKEDIAGKNLENIDGYIFKIMDILCDNYYASHKRKKLSEKLKNSILKYLKDGDDESRTYVIENMTKEVYGAAGRERVVMFESDFQIIELLQILRRFEDKTEVSKRFINLYFNVDPYNFYCKTKFLNYRSSCYWADDKKIIDAFESISDDENKDLIEEFIILYTVEHYNCNKQIHNKVMKYLVEKLGEKVLLEKFKPRSEQDRKLGYYIISEFSPNGIVKEKLNSEEDENAEKFMSEFKTFKKHDCIPFEFLYLSEDMKKKFVEFMVKKKNSYLYQSFVRDSIDINTDPVLKNSIDIFVESKLEIKMFLEYLIKASLELEESLKNYKTYYYARTDFDRNVLKDSINYLQNQGINCIELYSGFSIKEITELLRCLKENKNIKREEEVLKTLLENENKNIRSEAEAAIKNIGGEIPKLTLENFNLEKFVKENRIKKNIGITNEKISYPHLKDNKILNEDFVEILLYEFKKEDLFETREKIEFLSQFLDEKDLEKFGKDAFKYWNIKKEAKEKWLILTSIYYGDEKLLKEIIDLVSDFCENSRMKLACFIVESLSLRKEKWIIKAIDKIKRKSKFKSLRESANKALENVAELSGISKYMLSDYLVDDLDFVNNEKEMDYVDEKMILILDNSFNITYRMESGKILKNPPKKDGELEKESKNEIKLLKKSLKDEVTFIKDKLKEFYVEFRKWDLDEWKKSQENPLINIAYKNLVWGVYEGVKLKKIVSMNENIKLSENEKIGLVHYSEIEKSLEYNNSLDILDQFNCDEVIYKTINDVEIIPEIGRKSPTTVVNRLRKKGWNIGSVKDAGHFTEMYKEMKDLDLAVEVTFIEHPYMGGFGYETDSDDGLLGVEKIEFYKPGTIRRGSYIYDELEENRYKVSDITKRIFVEILKEIKESFV